MITLSDDLDVGCHKSEWVFFVTGDSLDELENFIKLYGGEFLYPKTVLSISEERQIRIEIVCYDRVNVTRLAGNFNKCII